MPQNVTNYDALLKDFYIGPINEALNQEANIFKRYAKAKVTWNGRRFVMPVHVSRNDGVAWSADGELPAAGHQGYVDLIGTRKNLYLRVQLDLEVWTASGGGARTAFLNAVDAELNGGKDDFVRTLNRTSVSGGRTVGFLAQRKNEAGADSVWAFDGDTAKLQRALTIMGGPVNMEVTRLDTYAPITTSIDVTTVTGGTTGTVVMATALNTLVGDVGTLFALRFSATDLAALLAGGLDLAGELTGMYGNIAERTHFNEDRTSATGTEALQADCFSVMAPATRIAITRGVFDAQNTRIFNSDYGGKKPDAFWVNAEQGTLYSDALTGTTAGAMSQTRMMSEDGGKGVTADLGFSGYAHAGKPLLFSRDLDNGLVIGECTSSWKVAESERFNWQDKTGAIWKQVDGEDRVYAYAVERCELVCKTPGLNGVVAGLTLS